MAMSSSNSNTGGYTARSARQTLNMNQPLPSPLSQTADPDQQQQPQQQQPQASTSTLPQDPAAAAAAPKRRLRPSTSSRDPSTPKRLRPSGSGSGAGGGGAGGAAKDYAPPTTRLADLGGVDACIEQMLELVALPLMHPEVYLHTGVRPPRGVLLVGPPGCGKTMLAGAIAGELALPFISISAPSIVSGMSGESEKTLRETFEEAAVRFFLPLFRSRRSEN